MFSDPNLEADSRFDEVSDNADRHPVLEQLQHVIADHMRANPQLTLNGISKKCTVSEPTLRRIVKGQVKTVINVTTLIDILSYLCKETDISKIITRYPGPIADHLENHVSFATEENSNQHYSEKLNRALRDPSRYLVYKLAANSSGVTSAVVKEILGFHGLTSLEELVAADLVIKKGDHYIADQGKKFALSHELFVQNFKTTADFIKPAKLGQIANNNLFVNFSGSVPIESYREIVRIQREALRKILKIRDSAEGNIPMFILAAVDTLSNKSAAEIEELI
jgi:hypothetical protein